MNTISESSSGYYEMITSQLTYTTEVNWKMLTRAGIWTCTFRIPVCHSNCWAIKCTGIGGEFLSILSAQNILATT